jgi:hypothetical protein
LANFLAGRFFAVCFFLSGHDFVRAIGFS